MLRTLPRLLAAFLLCAPLPAHAGIRLLATPHEARGGDVVTRAGPRAPDNTRSP